MSKKMVKTGIQKVATNKSFKKGVLTGLLLARKINRNKKKMKGGGINIKKALAIAAGPLGWVWLARNGREAEVKELQKRLAKYEPEAAPVEEAADDDSDDGEYEYYFEDE